MKKVMIYEEDRIFNAVKLLNCINVTGIENFRALAEIANIINSGTCGNYDETEEERQKNDMESKTV